MNSGDVGATGGSDDNDSVFVDDNCQIQCDENATARNQSPNRSSCDNQEEVDDIELIFSSDDKDIPQGDLVSISCYEPWQSFGKSGTPILVNFGRIGSDNETMNASLESCDENYQKDSMDQRQRIESSDSLNGIDHGMRRLYNYGTKSSSLEKDSDGQLNEMGRDESFDTFESVSETKANHFIVDLSEQCCFVSF